MPEHITKISLTTRTRTLMMNLRLRGSKDGNGLRIMNEKTRHVVFNKEPGMQLSTKPNQGIFSLSTEEVSEVFCSVLELHHRTYDLDSIKSKCTLKLLIENRDQFVVEHYLRYLPGADLIDTELPIEQVLQTQEFKFCEKVFNQRKELVLTELDLLVRRSLVVLERYLAASEGVLLNKSINHAQRQVVLTISTNNILASDSVAWEYLRMLGIRREQLYITNTLDIIKLYLFKCPVGFRVALESSYTRAF